MNKKRKLTSDLVQATIPICPECDIEIYKCGWEQWRCPKCGCYTESPDWAYHSSEKVPAKVWVKLVKPIEPTTAIVFDIQAEEPEIREGWQCVEVRGGVSSVAKNNQNIVGPELAQTKES